jgi:hypothetical protein
MYSVPLNTHTSACTVPLLTHTSACTVTLITHTSACTPSFQTLYRSSYQYANTLYHCSVQTTWIRNGRTGIDLWQVECDAPHKHSTSLTTGHGEDRSSSKTGRSVKVITRPHKICVPVLHTCACLTTHKFPQFSSAPTLLLLSA